MTNAPIDPRWADLVDRASDDRSALDDDRSPLMLARERINREDGTPERTTSEEGAPSHAARVIARIRAKARAARMVRV